ncbi:hypothetical protein niasHS_008160 [Heterodera schachtii]|uniref:Serpentine receptor class gamma n=1 Tax=Heterodera schachtii TaxID=97005 RepID=A0ABD2J1L9_HETSC
MINLLAYGPIVPFVFALLIGIPSAILYCLEVWVIIANFADFNSAFFVLVVVRAILSLANWICQFFENRFGKIGLFLAFFHQLPECALSFLYFAVNFAFHVENLLTVFLLLNRFSSILLPFTYNKLWRYALAPALIVSFVLPLPFTVPIFSLQMFIHVQNDNVSFTIDHYKNENAVKSSKISAWSAIFFGIICLLLNLASLVAYKFRRPKSVVGQMQSNYSTNNSMVERKMTIYTVVSFFGQLIMAIFMIIVYVTSTQFVDEPNRSSSSGQPALFGLSAEQTQTLFLANYNQYPWVNDLSTIAIPAWLLLWASTKMRQFISKKFQ